MMTCKFVGYLRGFNDRGYFENVLIFRIFRRRVEFYIKILGKCLNL